MAKSTMGQSKQEAVDMAVMAQDVKYIREVMEGIKTKVDEHDVFVTESKNTISILKWGLGTGWLTTIITGIILIMRSKT